MHTYLYLSTSLYLHTLVLLLLPPPRHCPQATQNKTITQELPWELYVHQPSGLLSAFYISLVFVTLGLRRHRSSPLCSAILQSSSVLKPGRTRKTAWSCTLLTPRRKDPDAFPLLLPVRQAPPNLLLSFNLIPNPNRLLTITLVLLPAFVHHQATVALFLRQQVPQLTILLASSLTPSLIHLKDSLLTVFFDPVALLTLIFVTRYPSPSLIHPSHLSSTLPRTLTST